MCYLFSVFTLSMFKLMTVILYTSSFKNTNYKHTNPTVPIPQPFWCWVSTLRCWLTSWSPQSWCAKHFQPFGYCLVVFVWCHYHATEKSHFLPWQNWHDDLNTRWLGYATPRQFVNNYYHIHYVQSELTFAFL